jgi:hypothetical protein
MTGIINLAGFDKKVIFVGRSGASGITQRKQVKNLSLVVIKSLTKMG